MNEELDKLINELEGFSRVQTVIEHDWGSIRLDKYLLNLMSDTRDGQRNGFPPHVAFALMKLQLLNLAELEKNGIVEDEADLDSRFTCNVTTWELPKNF